MLTEVFSTSPAVKSDHAPFKCTLTLPTISYSKPPKTTRLNWKKADYRKLCATLRDTEWSRLYECHDVNKKCDLFYELFNKAITDAVPLLKVNPTKYPVWFDNDTINALNDKNRAYRRWKHTTSTSSRIEHQVKRTSFKQLKNKKFQEYIKKVDNSLTKDPNVLWSYVRKNTRVPRVPVQVEYDGVKASDANSCSQLFANYFKTKFLPTNLQSDSLPAVPNFTHDSLSNMHFSYSEVESCLGSLKNGKSPGPDGIPVAALKYCRRHISRPLADVFNCAMKTGVFPTRWKSANVTPVLKKEADTV